MRLPPLEIPDLFFTSPPDLIRGSTGSGRKAFAS